MTFNPRTCGAHVGRHARYRHITLQSPFARGALWLIHPLWEGLTSIPVRTGRTQANGWMAARLPFNPRSHGAHVEVREETRTLALQSPFARGARGSS